MSLALSSPSVARFESSVAESSHRAAATGLAHPAKCALLGAGQVGKALLQRWERLASHADFAALRLVALADSRRGIEAAAGLPPHEVLACLAGAEASCNVDPIAALGVSGTVFFFVAPARAAAPSRHPDWLARGLHVVTACKLGQGTSLARWRAIRDGATRGRVRYGDAATVGAGLPALRSVRELRAGGDRIHAIAGVLSGSLAWLFSNYDGMRPFSALLQEARGLGYTEPDPREDLSGEDVRRKLLILARAAGVELDAAEVDVDSLVPTALAILPRDEALGALDLLDAELRRRFQAAHRLGRRLRFVARLDAGGARVGLEALEVDDPLAQGGGCDNRIAIWSDRYAQRPLLIQGPGAGAEVTAAAMLDDIAAVLRQRP
jgi:homoserine dehydrogenase